MLKINYKLFFFENFTGNFAIFFKFFKTFSRFSRKFMETFRKFWKYAFIGANQEKLFKKLVEKSIETCKILKVFMNF